MTHNSVPVGNKNTPERRVQNRCKLLDIKTEGKTKDIIIRTRYFKKQVCLRENLKSRFVELSEVLEMKGNLF